MTDRTQRPNHIPWPPLIVFILACGAWLLQRIFPAPWPLANMAWAGPILLLVAVSIDLTAFFTMRGVSTTVMPHRRSRALVTHGIFSLSRNPIYIAYLLILLGLGLWSANIWYVASIPVGFIALQKLAIEREEAHLLANFGDDYRAYMRTTRRWL